VLIDRTNSPDLLFSVFLSFLYNGNRTYADSIGISACAFTLPMRKRQRSQSLMISLAVILFISLLALGGMYFASMVSFLNARRISADKAFYFSEAGIRRAMYKIKNNDFSSPEPWDFCNQAVTVTIDTIPAEPDNYLVSAEAVFRAETKKIEAKVNKRDSTVLLMTWKQLN
jgi:Tfp pilus assembly protein PilX